ncbi:HlyD family efflux transporter periplasmic adaptor subunit [Rhodocyclaceae bacterium]
MSHKPLILLALLATGAFFIWQQGQVTGLPPGIAAGNGRLEATEVDVATKVGGKLLSVQAQESDDVAADQVLATLDAEHLAAQLRAVEAQVQQARAAATASQAGLASASSRQKLARLTLQRSEALVKKGFITDGKLDQDRSAVQTADAAVAEARSHIGETGSAVAAAQAKADELRVALKDATLRAPLAGRVLYRLAHPGEVLAAGGKVLTLLDMRDVFMSIYLPADAAGKVGVGDTAVIVLDALPDRPLPAHVAFVAPRAQFTPKEVETRNEREKLMFRVKLKVDPAWLAAQPELAKPGMPGVAYVRTAPDAAWPAGATLPNTSTP